MKHISKIIILALPLILTAQSSVVGKSRVEDRARWEGLRERMEAAVERGEITREQADKRYAGLRARLAGTRTERRDPIMENHYEKLGSSDLGLIKNGLLDQGIPASQLDAVLGGMLRLVHAAKTDGENFKMNPRIEIYFKDRLGLTDAQTEYVMGYSRRIAARDQ